jgi:hypothetical protein
VTRSPIPSRSLFSFQQLQRPFLQVFEHLAKTLPIIPRSSRKRRPCGRPSRTAEHRANPSEARLADAVATTEGQRAQIALIARERDEHAEHARGARGLRATLVERETALADLSRRADELLAAL